MIKKTKFSVCLIFLIISKNLFPKTNLEIWRNAFIDAAKAEALPPNLVVRNLAILTLGHFECVNSKRTLYNSYFTENTKPPENYDLPSSIRGFGLLTSKVLHPSRKSNFDRIAHKEAIDYGKVGHYPSFKYGESIAEKILKLRLDDGSTTKTTYIPNIDPGNWRRTPPYFRPPEQPHWPTVKLFSIPTLSKFLPPAPPEPSESSYFEAVKEVKLLGSKKSPLRTSEQTSIAKFWKDFSYSSTPPGHWNEIAFNLSQKMSISILEESRLFALLNIAMADAGIVAWETKYHYHLWRPIHAIRLAHKFETTKSLSNPVWEPLLESPSHPEYVSGHACYSGAASEILTQFFGTDVMDFSVKGGKNNEEFRKFNSFTECANEIANSRLFGGIHYSFSNEIGLQTGRKVARYVFKNISSPF